MVARKQREREKERERERENEREREREHFCSELSSFPFYFIQGYEVFPIS
jgi:hypothetical protein